MHTSPDFAAPQLFSDPAQALAQVQRIYQNNIDFLRQAMRDFVSGGDYTRTHVRACYPYVRLHTHSVLRQGSGVGQPPSRLSYGFVAGPGRYETTLTRPDLYAGYYLDQFRRNKWVIVTGDHDICRAPNEQFSSLLRAKGIQHSLHVWNNSKHDWPYWRPMAAAYLP